MPPSTPTFGIVSDVSELPDLTPIEFAIVGYNIERQPTTYTLHARPNLPLGVMLDVADAANADGSIDPTAVRNFLDAVIAPADAEAWGKLIRDPDVYFVDRMLQELVEWLAAVYSDRPTLPPSASQPGGGSTGTSSTDVPASPALTSAVSQ